MNESVRFGTDPLAPYVAFGDDSAHGNALVFAYVIFPRENLERARRRLLRIKRKFRIPEETVIHCRELFHHHPRLKAGLGHLSNSAARSIVGHLIHEINILECWVKFAYFRVPDGGIVYPPGDDHICTPSGDTKEMLAMLAQACFGGAADGTEGPPNHACEIFVSEDQTLINFFGPKRSRADSKTGGFSDVGAGDGQVFSAQTTPLQATSEPLLQYADVISYACSHTYCQPRDQFFYEHFGRIQRWVRKEFVTNTEGYKAPTSFP